MTVRLLAPYGSYPKNSNLTTNPTEEARLLRENLADTNTGVGTAYSPASTEEWQTPVSLKMTINGAGVTTDKLFADNRELSIGGAGSGLAVQNDASAVVPQAASLDFQGPLRASGAGSAAAISIDQANVLQTPAPDGIAGYSGYALYRSQRSTNIPVGGFPRRRNLAVWYSPSDVNVRVANGSGSVASDYTDPIIGEPYNAANSGNSNLPTNGQTIRINGGASSAVVVGSKAVLPVALDVTGKNIYLQYKILSGDISNLNITVRLHSTTGTPNATASGPDYHIADFNQPYTAKIKAGRWNTQAIPIEQFTATGAGATLTAITHIYVAINTVGAASLLLGDCFMCPRVLQRGVAIIGFDDCRQDTWTHAARYMKRYGMPGVLYPGSISNVIRQNVDQFQMNLSQLQHLQERYGWQVASQAWSNENPSVNKPGQTLPQFAGEMAAMQGFYEGEGFTGGADGSYFSSVDVGDTREEVFRKSFRTMRGFTIWSAGSAPNAQPDPVPLGDRYNLRAWGMDTSFHTVALTGAFVDKAIAQKAVARFIFHGTDVGTANFTNLIDYLAQKQAEGVLDVMTEDQLIFTARARAFD